MKFSPSPVQTGAAAAGAARPDIESFYHLSGCSLPGKACQGTACFAARRRNPKRWNDAVQSTERIYCAGRCFEGPALVGSGPEPHREIRSREAIVLKRMAQGGAASLDSFLRLGGGDGLARALQSSPESVLEEIEKSELRGRGGAGFSAGKKWRAAWQQPGGEKHIVANADEGDAGAYMDRFILEEDPFRLIEGMCIAAWTIGARQGWIYLRCEYPDAAARLQSALAEARSRGWLGNRIGGRDFSFDIQLVEGQGSYVCGEETAMLRSIEGKRPEVMARPPFATERGLFGKPTLIQNVETWVNIPWILERGGEAYRALGFSTSRGTKVVSLNSLFAKPGLYEIDFGIPVSQIVEMGGGLREGSIQALLIGGPLSGILPPGRFDTRFGFEELRAVGAGVGHGGIVAFDESTSLIELAHHIFSFGAYESCGKCTPCRLGTGKIESILQEYLRSGKRQPGSREAWNRCIAALKAASLCGHGSGLADFALSIQRYFEKELDSCLM